MRILLFNLSKAAVPVLLASSLALTIPQSVIAQSTGDGLHTQTSTAHPEGQTPENGSETGLDGQMLAESKVEKAPEPKRVCHLETRVGSNMPRKVCKTITDDQGRQNAQHGSNPL